MSCVRIRPQNFSGRQVDSDSFEEEKVRVLEDNDAACRKGRKSGDVVLTPNEGTGFGFVRRSVVQGR